MQVHMSCVSVKCSERVCESESVHVCKCGNDNGDRHRGQVAEGSARVSAQQRRRSARARARVRVRACTCACAAMVVSIRAKLQVVRESSVHAARGFWEWEWVSACECGDGGQHQRQVAGVRENNACEGGFCKGEHKRE